jgi:hypothetical protein
MRYCLISSAEPATTGVAMLVPCCLACLQVPSTLLLKALSEPAEMSTPGATMSGLTLQQVVAQQGEMHSQERGENLQSPWRRAAQLPRGWCYAATLATGVVMSLKSQARLATPVIV